MNVVHYVFRGADLAADATGALLAATPAGAGPATVWAVWNGETAQSYGVHYQVSTDDGISWSAPNFLWRGDSPSIARTPEGLAMAWYDYDCVGGLLGACQSDISYATRDDGGATWSAAVRYTQFQGRDFDPEIAGLAEGGFAISWYSSRRHSSVEYTENTTVWFGNPAVHQDVAPPPAILREEHFPVANPQVGDEVTIMARVEGDLAFPPDLLWNADGVEQASLAMTEVAGEPGLFEASLGAFDTVGTDVDYRFRAVENNGSVMNSFSRSFILQPMFVRENEVLVVVDSGRQSNVDFVKPFYEAALDAAGIGYDLWDTSVLGPPLEDRLGLYLDATVVWSAPYSHSGWLFSHPIYQVVTTAIGWYLDNGGDLFVSGQDVADRGRWYDREWLEQHLRSQYVSCCVPDYVEGMAGDPIGDGLAFYTSGGDGANNSWGSDEIRPTFGAEPVFRYVEGAVRAGEAPTSEAHGPRSRSDRPFFGAGLPDRHGVPQLHHPDGPTIDSVLETGGPPAFVGGVEAPSGPVTQGIQELGIAAVRAETETETQVSRMVFFAFNFESIDSSATRTEVMSRVINWLTSGVGRATCNGRPVTIEGTDGPDTIFGTDGDDVIAGLGGADTIFGLDGNDVICAGGGADVVHGGPGDDWIGGFGGADMINGGPGRDSIYGHGGADLLLGSSGDDVVYGGGGADALYGNEGDDIIKGDRGDDYIECGDGIDAANGGPGLDSDDGSCELTTLIEN